jgi:glycosyltransferase involved in cell wall biosynthesis
VVFVGSGPLRSAIRNWQIECPDVPIVITDFVQPSGIPKFYAIADVFVMPTLDDNWSLVSLEAAVAGVPQLSSPYNGSASDLLYDQRVGRVVDPLKTEELVSALRDCVQSAPSRLPDELVRQFSAYYSPEQVALRAWKSLENALA